MDDFCDGVFEQLVSHQKDGCRYGKPGDVFNSAMTKRVLRVRSGAGQLKTHQRHKGGAGV